MAKLSHFYITEGCVVVLFGKKQRIILVQGELQSQSLPTTNLFNEKSACNDLDATTKVPIRSEMMINRSESRHSSLGELVTKVGIADASGRKDPLNAAGHPATFIKFIQTVSNLKIQTKLQL